MNCLKQTGRQAGRTPLGGGWAAGDALIAGVSDRECACVEVSMCVFPYRKQGCDGDNVGVTMERDVKSIFTNSLTTL